MPGVAPQQSRTFDPVAAQAALRRDRVAKIRTTVTTTINEKKPLGRGFQGTSSWKEGDAVRKEDYEATNRKPVDRLAGDSKDWKPMGQGFQGAPPWKEGDAVRKEDYDKRQPGTESQLNSNPANWKPMGGNGFQGSPLPQQLNGPDSNLPVRSREEEAADRQMDAAEASGDFAAQNRARAMQNRAQKKAADRAAPTDDGEPSEAMQALSKFVTHGSATTGIGILLTQSVMFYRFFLTVYHSYDERLRSWGMLNLVPGKYDLRKTTDIFDLILCIVELGLFLILLVVGFVIFLVLVRAIV